MFINHGTLLIRRPPVEEVTAFRVLLVNVPPLNPPPRDPEFSVSLRGDRFKFAFFLKIRLPVRTWVCSKIVVLTCS